MQLRNLLFTFSILSTVFTTQMIGQDDSRSNVQFGIKAGANYANVYDAQGDDFEAEGKLGLAAGVFLALPLGEIIGFQPEVMFSQKGFSATGSLLGANYGLTRTKNYLDIPLYLTIKPAPAVTIVAGPQFSYLLSQKDVYETGLGSVEQIQEFDNDNIRKNIFGISAGVDVNIQQVVLGLRGAWDLSSNKGDGTSTTPRYKNAVIQATLGYRFM